MDSKPFSQLIEISDSQRDKFVSSFSDEQFKEELKESFSDLTSTEDQIDFSNPQNYLQDSTSEGEFDIESLLEPDIVSQIIEMEASELSGASLKFWEMAQSLKKNSFLGTD